MSCFLFKDDYSKCYDLSVAQECTDDSWKTGELIWYRR